MKIGLDISPLSTGHKVRGVGFYVKLLMDNLEKFDKKNSYDFFSGSLPRDLDVVHYPYFDPFQITLPRRLPKKTLVTVHDLTPIVFKDHFPSGFKGNLRFLIQKRRLAKASMIIADSECSKKDIIRLIGIPEERVRVVYLAANEVYKSQKHGKWENDFRKRFGLPEEFVLYVGDATWNKNLPNLINAIKQTSHKLVMVGKVWENTLDSVPDNPWNKDLREVLSEIENDDRFMRLGFVSDLELCYIYNLATVFIMPSVYEGFGLPVLEAMNCGAPVITTRGGSLPEVAGTAGYYVEPNDPENIKEAINAMMSDAKLRTIFSRKSIAQAKKFSIKKMIEETADIYSSV
ncbi:MAG TPA: glycosyltransferase family 1 protein [Patescibacteria group bacterium]|nr:glycosyltransferase family 1 protein [Patescibacteria group bacterium]